MNTLTKSQIALTLRPDLSAAGQQFAIAASCSRMHSEMAASALHLYGSHGAQISGCVRDHFPERMKNHLRTLAQNVTKHNAQAMALRPARVRVATMNQLARVICKRDGSGFYGYAPAK